MIIMERGVKMDSAIEKLREKAMKLPLSPGVYIMKNSKDVIIYIGKAKALKNRVSSYFGSNTTHTQKVVKMVEQVADFDYIITESEFEALVLECALIKQNKPKYNVLLKDDKGYHYIKITNDDWITISAEKQKLKDGAKYIGPFTASSYVSQVVDEACKIYRLPQCGKTFSNQSKKVRPCLNYFISQCSAPCAGKISKKDYDEAVSEAIRFIEGGSAKALKRLKAQMNYASEKLDFEKAAKLRDRIAAIEKIGQKQLVVSQKTKNQDVFAVAESNGHVCLMVFRFLDGNLYDSEHFFTQTEDNSAYMRAKLITNYYSIRENIPPVVSVDEKPEDKQLIEQWLTEKRGKKTKIIVPEKGEQLKLVELCKTNAAEKLAQKLGRVSKQAKALDELASLLNLNSAPEYIEAYDISHTAGANNVGGMVVYKDGKPYKAAYRHFMIKGFEGQDDYRSMSEMLMRRMTEYEKYKDTDNSFGKLPDLILLDGGKGQVNAVIPVLQGASLNIPVFGMVKDGRHRTRAIAQSGGEISIDEKRKAFTLISEIQNEVHRFSVDYHRKKQLKSGLSLSLLEIEGVGEVRSKELIKKFKTIEALSKASIQEIKSVKGLNITTAKKIYKFFNTENGEKDD